MNLFWDRYFDKLVNIEVYLILEKYSFDNFFYIVFYFMFSFIKDVLNCYKEVEIMKL